MYFGFPEKKKQKASIAFIAKIHKWNLCFVWWFDSHVNRNAKVGKKKVQFYFDNANTSVFDFYINDSSFSDSIGGIPSKASPASI